MISRISYPLATLALVAIAFAPSRAQDSTVASADTKMALPAINPDDTAKEPSKGKPPRGERGSIDVVTRPAGGEVYYDGEYMGKAPLKVEVGSGRNELRISLDGNLLIDTRVNVWPGQTTAVAYELRLPIGYLVVTTTPAKAQIYLNGTPVGRTDGAELRINKAKSGGAFIKAEAGSKSAIQQINIPREDTLKVHLNLK